MGFQDRHYYRDRESGPFNPFMWLLNGSVHLFTFSGIRVRAHASLIVTIVLVLLFGLGQGFTWQDRVQSMSMLFLIVLLHEFGHSFAARWVGGDANEILMSPLGGLAFANPPRRPLPTFITVAAGPAVNLLICIACGVVLYVTMGWVPWNPLRLQPMQNFSSWANVIGWASWIYQMSYFLLMFNLLPIYPLDGGQMLHAILWPRLGFYKASNFAYSTGMVGGIIMCAVGLASWSPLLVLIGLSGFLTCLNLRRMLMAQGEFGVEDSIDYSAAYETFSPKPNRRPNRRAAQRAAKLAKAEQLEQQRIDEILAKVSAHGMHSLNWMERRALKKATEHQRQRDIELGRTKRH
jgi:Zn-dependent protease